MAQWIYTPISQTLATDFVVSTGRFKAISIHLSNADTSKTAQVRGVDNDGNIILDLVVFPLDSYNVSYGDPVDFDNGLTFCLITDPDASNVRLTIAKTRDL